MVAFRGPLCIRTASVLSFVAMWLLIFVHIGQLSSSGGPRRIYFAQLNTSGYGDALHALLIDPIVDLYTDNATAPLNQHLGLRRLYKFGIYGYCGYVNRTDGRCSNQTIAHGWTPYHDMTVDMASNYSRFTDALLLNNTFSNDGHFSNSSHAAYYMILLATVCAALATIVGFFSSTTTFFIATVLAVVGSILVLVGASIWTAIIEQAKSINVSTAGPTAANAVSLGLAVTAGPALYLVWAAAASLLLSVVPYMTSCCTFR